MPISLWKAMSLSEQLISQDVGPPERASLLDALLRSQPLPIIQSAVGAFRRDLAQMLTRHRGQWVAYRGEDRIGFGSTQRELYELCRQRGWKPEELLICGVEEAVLDPDQEYTASSNV